ncbi:MAG: DEAD/DEAH box helicase, partial [Oscillospiraceae bacterium]|nr:DEAD/DEAH box helicase [Oscillospiraceae bacterium]
MDFSQLGLSPRILEALDEQGYSSATPIQEASIPTLMTGRDLLGCAQTGTGKTAAFALPILQKLGQRSDAA